MEAPLSRRRFFQLVGALGTAVAVPAVRAQPLPASGPDVAPEGAFGTVYRFFTIDEAAFVTAAVDRLIPEDDWPSASQAGVVTYLDLQLAGAYGSGDRLYLNGPWQPGSPEQGYQLPLTPAQLYRIAIAGVEQRIGEERQGARFADLPATEQDRILGLLETGSFPLTELPPPIFFETLLANTIEGYFADPIYGGNRDMAGWRMVGFPGAYANYLLEVEEHGERFRRPPIGMQGLTSGDRRRISRGYE